MSVQTHLGLICMLSYLRLPLQILRQGYLSRKLAPCIHNVITRGFYSIVSHKAYRYVQLCDGCIRRMRYWALRVGLSHFIVLFLVTTSGRSISRGRLHSHHRARIPPEEH